MGKDETNLSNSKHSSEDRDNKMDRRDFFKTTGKLVIPTLGILGLSLVAGSVQAACRDCDGSCKVDCGGSCRGDCSKVCRDDCAANCRDSCLTRLS